MAHVGQVVGAISAVEIAFRAELQRRSLDPMLAAGVGAYEIGCRTTEDLVKEAIQMAVADPFGEQLLGESGRNLFDQGFVSETDVAMLMQSGWRSFAAAAAPVGHQDPTSCVMARRLWLALTRIIVILGFGGGQVIQAAGIGPLDPLMPLKIAQQGEKEEGEELARLESMRVLGGSGSCLTPGSVSSSGKEGKGSASTGLVSVTDLDGREVTSGLKGLVTRVIELQGIRRLCDQGRLPEYQGTMVELRPDHIRGLISMYSTRAATFNASSLPAHWRSAALSPGLQGCRVLSDEAKFRRFLEVEFSPLSLKDLSIFDFGPASTPLSGCSDPSVVTSEFKDALLVALERAELVFMCYFGSSFEGFSSPLSRRLKARDAVLYTLPDVILNYYVHNCFAAFSYSVRNESAPEGAVWYGDGPSAARLRDFFQGWVDTVSDLSNSTVASFKMQILPQLIFGGGKHARSDEGDPATSKGKPKSKKKSKSSGNTASGVANNGQGSGTTKGGSGGSGGTSGGVKGGSSSSKPSSTSGQGTGTPSSSKELYCIYKVAELFGLKTLAGNTFACRLSPCPKFHPASKQAADKDEARKAVKASSHLKWGPELLKLIA